MKTIHHYSTHDVIIKGTFHRDKNRAEDAREEGAATGGHLGVVTQVDQQTERVAVNRGMTVEAVNRGMPAVVVNRGMTVVAVNRGMTVVAVNRGMTV